MNYATFTKESAGHVLQLVDNIPTPVWSADAHGAIDFLNQRWIDYTGLRLQEFQGRLWIDAGFIHPEDITALIDRWHAILASGQIGEAEARMKRFDGEYRWFLFRIMPLHDKSGRVVKWYGTNIEMEDRKWTEALLAGEKRLLEMIAGTSTLEEVLEEICRLVERTVSESLCGILLIDPIANQVQHGAAPNLPQSYNEAMNGLPVNPRTGPCAMAACIKAQVIASDIVADTRWNPSEWRTLAIATGLRSCWSAPIFSANGNVLGTFAIYSRKPRSPYLQQQKMIEQITNLTSIAIERSRNSTALRESEEQIRRSEQQYRQIVEAIPQFISVITHDGSFLYSNKLVCDYTGLSDEDFRTTDFRSRIYHPEDTERTSHLRQQGLLRGLPFELEQRVRRKDGQYRWFLTRYNPSFTDEGQLIRWYITSVDIDERKRAEERVQKENIALREEIDKISMFEEIVGGSEGIRQVLSRVEKVAPTDSTVLITGETGTGKELIARAIHKRSKRAQRPFISVNCAAIPQSLIASELFGHEKGAFTGAQQRRTGRFELADGGTIFLDEISELPIETQIVLLRVLQERTFERVGAAQPIRTDVRVIAATNRDLEASIESGKFRSDLFYRFNVFPIQIPPLRERKEDIPMLVKYFIERYSQQMGKKIQSIDKKTLAQLQSYSWPGNIRELQNVIERSIIICDTQNFLIDESWVFRESNTPAPVGQKFTKQVMDHEKEMIEAALNETKGRVSGPMGAATRLGIPTSTLETKIKSLKIDKYRFKTAR